MQPPAAMMSRRPDCDRPDVSLNASLHGFTAPGLGADLGPLLPRTVHVWAINVDSQNDPNPHHASLSPAEWRRAQGFRFERDRHRFIARRDALRQLLGRYLALEPAEIEIDKGEGRKPAVAGPHRKYGATGVPPDIQFSCSHSEGLALLAFAHGIPVGVDLERLRPMPEVEDVARRFFAPREYRALVDMPLQDRPAGFYKCWTRKEAVVKALGLGLAMPLDSFTVSFAPGRPARLLHLDAGDRNNWTLVPLQLSPGYFAALAICARRPVNIVTSWR